VYIKHFGHVGALTHGKGSVGLMSRDLIRVYITIAFAEVQKMTDEELKKSTNS